MKTERKLFLRTETFEQILISSRPARSNFREDTGKAIDLSHGKYRVEIYQIDTNGKQMIFECELFGSIEIGEPTD
jgi:hypothetical protein